MTDAEPTQETQPAKGEPATIPVPKREDVMAALRRVAKADEGKTFYVEAESISGSHVEASEEAAHQWAASTLPPNSDYTVLSIGPSRIGSRTAERFRTPAS